jgi:hypothetical protein
MYIAIFFTGIVVSVVCLLRDIVVEQLALMAYRKMMGLEQRQKPLPLLGWAKIES